MHIMKESDYQEHVRTYRGFIKTSAYCAAGVAIVLALMAIFLI